MLTLFPVSSYNTFSLKEPTPTVKTWIGEHPFIQPLSKGQGVPVILVSSVTPTVLIVGPMNVCGCY